MSETPTPMLPDVDTLAAEIMARDKIEREYAISVVKGIIRRLPTEVALNLIRTPVPRASTTDPKALIG
jgi:hypothetical protein